MTAMESLEQMGAVAPGIPRFDDGMVNLRELIRLMAEALVNEIMDAQADEACAEGNQRNGYRERTLVTSVGPITLRIPKLRVGSYFPEDLLVRYSRVDRAVIAAVSEMVTNGVSTRKVEKAAHAMGIGRMSASQVSRICESLDAVVEDLQTRVFGELRFPYLWLDATYLKCRDAGHASPTALVTATACGDDGYRRLRANNVQERVNREVKCRSRVVQVFPSRKSLIRMLGAVLSEKDEDWSTRRRFTATSISEAYEEPECRKPAPKPTYKGTAAEHAARIIALVLSGNVDSIGKAA